MSQALRTIDARVRMALKGTETIRGVVRSTPIARVVLVEVAGTLLPAIVPALPVVLAVGDVVELRRPRGVGGQLQIVAVLGRT